MAAYLRADPWSYRKGGSTHRWQSGALQYLEYDVFTRTLMRLKMGKDGHPTDISHDCDSTDWDAVDEFGREVATLFVAPSGSV